MFLRKKKNRNLRSGGRCRGEVEIVAVSTSTNTGGEKRAKVIPFGQRNKGRKIVSVQKPF